MKVIEIQDGVSGYPLLVDTVLRYGKKRSPRGIETRDLGPVTIVMYDVWDSLPLGINRNVNRRIGAAEAVQLIGGFSAPQLLFDASQNFKQFVEPDSGTFHGAYGMRIRNQFAHAVEKLRHDPDTRQSVITLWDPWLDNIPGKRDYPCTVSLILAIVDDKVELTVLMRSQDVWWGTPFDWFQFTQLQMSAAHALDKEVGTYRHITNSTHLYARNYADVERLTDPPPVKERERQPQGIGRPGDSIREIMNRARDLPYHTPINATASELWYRAQFTKDKKETK